MPGFALAKKAAEIFDAHSECEGLLLLGHGHFAFGKTAKESYDLIVSHTQAVADYLNMEKPTELFVREEHDVQHVLPVIRGLVAEMVGANAPMPVLDLRNGPEQRGFLERTDIDDLAKRGTASPDHVIRIKAKPLVLRKSVWSAGREAILAALDGYASEYL